jgi:enterochelin esterase-like enzyme
MNCAIVVRAVVAISVLFLFFVHIAFAQIISPEVHPDRTVTFRLLAPNAKEVSVGGEFSAPLPMNKGDKGIWSVTTKPLSPDIYGYNFNMDGLSMPDPNNTSVKTGVIWFGSQLNVPRDNPAFFAERNVPHGTLHGHWYFSNKLGTVRHVLIYTPPGYEATLGNSCPVLYLLHGYGDDEGAWTQVGRANFIMDNLLADNKAKPVVIVMPFGHPSRSLSPLPRRQRGVDAAGVKDNQRSDLFGVKALETDLLENIIPLVEREYRVSKDRSKRAIAGLSMGGYQSLSIGLNNLQFFSHIGAFSSALTGKEYLVDFKTILDDPEKANKEIKLLWIGCGTIDDLLTGNEKFDELLTSKKITHEWIKTPDYGHAWPLWRSYLNDLLPKLFQDN